MKGQVVLLEAILIFYLVVTLLMLSKPLFQEVGWLPQLVRKLDVEQTYRLLNG